MPAAGITVPFVRSFVAGYSVRRRAKTVSTCACASSTLRPSASRPLRKSQRFPRCWIRVVPGSLSVVACTPPKLSRSTIVTGTQNSGCRPGMTPEKPAGATPTTVYATPLTTTVWSTMSVLPPKRPRHIPWPITRTGCCPSPTFSSGRKPRPRAGRTPSTSK